MRILYVTNGFPYPLTSGYLRHYHLIRHLAADHDVELYSIVGQDFRDEHVDGLRPYTTRVQVFRSRARSRSVWRKGLSRLVGLATREEGEAAARKMAVAIARSVAERNFDVVLLSGKRTDPVLRSLGRLPVVVDMCDATSARLLGTLPFVGPVHRIALAAELRRVRAVEARLMATGSHLFFASRRDRDLLLDDRIRVPTTVLPNGVDADYWSRKSASLGHDTLVFTGAMSYPPNADAAHFLLEEIMPRVWAEEASVRVVIAGRDPGPELQTRGKDARVEITGFVDDMRPHLDAASTFVAPLRFAAGIQNKLLEALAMELPIVTSAVAAAGLETDDAQPPVTIADDANDFAAHVLGQLRRVRSNPAPHAAGRQYVTRHFDWERSATTLERVLRDAVQQ